MKRLRLQSILFSFLALAILAGLTTPAYAAPRDIHGGPTRMPLELPGIDDFEQEPEFDPPIPELDFDVSGTLNLSSCVAPARSLKVQITGPIAPRGIFTRVVDVTGSAGRFTYNAENLPRVQMKVRPILADGACRNGRWTPGFRMLTPHPSQDAVANINFSYRAPSRVDRIDGSTLALLAQARIGPIDVVADNYGPRRGTSRHQANASSVTIQGEMEKFTIAEKVVDIDLCGWCPDFGDAKFYVVDMNSRSTDITWDRGLKLGINFESDGREVKGFYSNGTFGSLSDRGAPDAHIDNARITANLKPVADGKGSVRFELVGNPQLDADIQATGACGLKGIDLCDALTDYKDKIADRVGEKLAKKLRGKAFQDALEPHVRKALDAAGIGHVLDVRIEGQMVVISSA